MRHSQSMSYTCSISSPPTMHAPADENRLCGCFFLMFAGHVTFVQKMIVKMETFPTEGPKISEKHWKPPLNPCYPYSLKCKKLRKFKVQNQAGLALDFLRNILRRCHFRRRSSAVLLQPIYVKYNDRGEQKRTCLHTKKDDGLKAEVQRGEYRIEN